MDIPDGLLAVSNGLVTYAGSAPTCKGDVGPSNAKVILLPGLVDLHCHGAFGSDFSEGSVGKGRSAARYLHRRGTTTLLASLVTGTQEHMLRNISALRSLTEEGLIAGSHLEGPFLASQQCGAHNPSLLLHPDIELVANFLEAAGPSLSTMTLAAELPGALQIVDLLTQHGVVPSLGHTAAAYRPAREFLAHVAVRLASSSNPRRGRMRPTVTHLFNAMPSLHHRSPGAVAACLGAAHAGVAVVELIADGVHLDAEVVKLVFELVGSDNIALITDSISACGLQDGRYFLGESAVTVQQGVARADTTGVIAGGTATLLDVVRATVASGVPLQDAVKSASYVPASVLGLSSLIGDLRPGMQADVVVVDQNLRLLGVVRRGEWVLGIQHRSPAA